LKQVKAGDLVAAIFAVPLQRFGDALHLVLGLTSWPGGVADRQFRQQGEILPLGLRRVNDLGKIAHIYVRAAGQGDGDLDALAFGPEQDWQEVFPDLPAGLLAESWQQAWRTWCQPRGLMGLGIETCPVEPEGHRLRVVAPPRLMERLHATRSDALKGEAWILGGGERLRPAALLDIIEEGTKAAVRQ
jgi:hypothetical protein